MPPKIIFAAGTIEEGAAMVASEDSAYLASQAKELRDSNTLSLEGLSTEEYFFLLGIETARAYCAQRGQQTF